MRSLQLLYGLLAASALVGCKSHTGLSASARDFDWSCANNAEATTSAPMVSATGVVKEVLQINRQPAMQPVEGAMLTACTIGPDGEPDWDACQLAPDATDVSRSDGGFDVGPKITCPSGVADCTTGTPYNGYMHISMFGHKDTFLVPKDPLWFDRHNMIVPFLRNSFAADLGALGLNVDKGNGTVGFKLYDCAGAAVNDSASTAVLVKQNGVEVPGTYFVDGNLFNEDFQGDFFIINVPPGDVTISAVWNAQPFRDKTVRVFADAYTLTEMTPGAATTW